jgi:hypothetical protein
VLLEVNSLEQATVSKGIENETTFILRGEFTSTATVIHKTRKKGGGGGGILPV